MQGKSEVILGWLCPCLLYTSTVDRTLALIDAFLSTAPEEVTSQTSFDYSMDYTASVSYTHLYGQTGETNWMSSAQYEGAQIDGDNLKFISAINNTGVNEVVNPVSYTHLDGRYIGLPTRGIRHNKSFRSIFRSWD